MLPPLPRIPRVISASASIEMRRIDARRIVAGMANDLPRGDRTIRQLVGNACGSYWNLDADMPDGATPDDWTDPLMASRPWEEKDALIEFFLLGAQLHRTTNSYANYKISTRFSCVTALLRVSQKDDNA